MLREDGLDLSRVPETDPFAAPVALFAAIVVSSLSATDVAKRL